MVDGVHEVRQDLILSHLIDKKQGLVTVNQQRRQHEFDSHKISRLDHLISSHYSRAES